MIIQRRRLEARSGATEPAAAVRVARADAVRLPLDPFHRRRRCALMTGSRYSSPPPPVRVRRSSPSTRCPARSTVAGALHDADQGALEPEVPRPRAHPLAPNAPAAHRRQLDQRRRAGGRHDHRGAAQHDLRGVAGRSSGLDVVVLDEVHFLQDTYRGPVWEEVIIHLPAARRASCASRPPCRNAEELADWIATVRGPTTAVIEERRPVQSRQPVHGRRHAPRTPAPPADACRRTAEPGGGAASTTRRYAVGAAAGAGAAAPGALFTPRRSRWSNGSSDESDAARDLLHLQPQRSATRPPRRCLDAGVALTDRRRARSAIREIVDARLGDRLTTTSRCSATSSSSASWSRGRRPPRRDGAAVQGGRRGVLRRGPGEGRCSPPRRSPSASTCRPRTVVIEKLSKFTGEHHAVPHAGRVHAAHRAGRAARHRRRRPRRSCCGRPFVPFDQVAALASSRAFHAHLGVPARRTTWRRTWCARYPAEQAHHLLNLSFAQYQADRDVVRARDASSNAVRRNSPSFGACRPVPAAISPITAASSASERRRHRRVRS